MVHWDTLTSDSDARQNRRLKRAALTAAAAIGATGAGYAAFVFAPEATGGSFWVWLGISYVSVMAALIAWAAFDPDPDVTVVSIDDEITRESGPMGNAVDADEVIETIREADDSDTTQGLCLRLNTPGGEIVPSEDIRKAVEEFDGPTLAYAEDTCASGGYLIATAADHIVARRGCHIGSIGVIGSMVNLSEWGETHGIDYERFAAGKFKDAGQPLKKPSDDERTYIQSLIDQHYDLFVERVAAARGLSETAIRDTEARIYLGDRAHTLGLVDEVGDPADVMAWFEAELDDEDTWAEEVTPQNTSGLNLGIGATMQRTAFAFGAGLADRLTGPQLTAALRRGFRR